MFFYIKHCAHYVTVHVSFFFYRTDTDYEEHHLKPELLKMISYTFPNEFRENDFAKNNLRDKILECVNLASEVSKLS